MVALSENTASVVNIKSAPRKRTVALAGLLISMTIKKLYGHPDSGHAFKVKLFMSVAGIEHDYELVDIFIPREQRPAEFLAHSRFGEVPVLVDDGQALMQSNAILIHLAREARQWGGEDSQTLNRCTEWLVWEANKIGMCLPQLRSRYKFGSDAALDGALDWLSARYEHDVNALEQALADGRDWIIGGETPTIADFSLCGYLVFADEAKVAVPSRVSAWLERIGALPGYQHPYDLLG